MSPSPDAVERLRELLSRRPEVVAAYLYGSTARAAAGEQQGRDPADVDVAVVLSTDADGLPAALALQAHLESELGRPVDLHELDRLPVDLRLRIIREGQVLVDRDPVRRVRAEIRILNEHADLAPHLELLRSATRDRLTAEPHRG